MYGKDEGRSINKFIQNEIPVKKPGKQVKNNIKSQISENQEISQENLKTEHELTFWTNRVKEEGILNNEHYEQIFTVKLGLTKEFYTGKKVLDIGCGPRGSLEWADNAMERIGLDPLADSYKDLGARNHKMDYVCSGSENIPFPDNYFDVISSFNSLDHVDDLNRTIHEIKRVLKKNGLFLLITEVNHEPTICEPISFSFDIAKKFKPLKILSEKHFEQKRPGIYFVIDDGILYDHSIKKIRPGVLVAEFKKEESM